jgi:hypothetical protein
MARLKNETKIAVDLIQAFEALVPLSLEDRENGKSVRGVFRTGWKVLAVDTSIFIKSRYESIHSALQCKTDLLKILIHPEDDWILDKANKPAIASITGHFEQCLNLLFLEYARSKNTDYKGRVLARSATGNRIPCDISTYLEKAVKVLTLASQSASKKDLKWEDVSCALALVTGRRMSEIHFSGVFTVVNDYEVEFSGQLKGKSRAVEGTKLKDVIFTIPTLVKANLVVDGVNWLERNDKRLPETGTTEEVNKKWNKYIGLRCKAEWAIIPDESWQIVDSKDKWTYHKMRGLYFIACVYNLEGTMNFSSIKRLAPGILGDADLSAIEPYERVDIVPGSVARI